MKRYSFLVLLACVFARNLMANDMPDVSPHSYAQDVFYNIFEVDTPAIYIKKGDAVEKLLNIESNDYELSFFETSDYLILLVYFNDRSDSIIYRKNDGRVFLYQARAGNGGFLYTINYETRTFDFFEISIDGQKQDITSIPIPNDSDHWGVFNETLLVSYDYDRRMQEFYILEGTTLVKHAEYPLNLLKNLSADGYAFYNQHIDGKKDYDTIMVNLYTLEETNIGSASGTILGTTSRLHFFADNIFHLGYFDNSNDTYTILDGIYRYREPFLDGGYYYSPFFIRGWEDYPISGVFRFEDNQLTFNSENKICIYNFETKSLQILWDYNTIEDKINSRLYMLNDNTYRASDFGISHLISFGDSIVIHQFILKWVDLERPHWDFSMVAFYETMESDILIYPFYVPGRD